MYRFVATSALLSGVVSAAPQGWSALSILSSADASYHMGGAGDYGNAGGYTMTGSASPAMTDDAQPTTVSGTRVLKSAPSVAIDQSGNVPGYTNADASFADDSVTPLTELPTSFGMNSQIPASHVSADVGASQVSSYPTGHTSHGPYSGTATTTGAVMNTPYVYPEGTIPTGPLAATKTYYNTNGMLQTNQPIPYTPAGGLGTNGSEPRYMVESDFDYESLALGLYQEWIELDAFNNAVALFSEEEFLRYGLTPEDVSLIQFMGQQEQGHATLITNLLGETAPVQCTYNHPFTNPREFVDYQQILTRWGESGVWGFINHLDSREVGQLLAQSIATEARQEMIFRQMSGLHPMPVWFEAGIPQSWAWTFMAPYISSCPENQTRLAWQNFPALHVANQANINRVSPNDTAIWERVDNRTSSPATIPEQDDSCINLNKTGYGCGPAITRNRSEPLSFPGKQVLLEWDTPGKPVGPNNSYVTSVSDVAGEPAYVAWAAQLNLTYTPLTVTGPNTGYTYQPNATVYENGQQIVNGTMFIAVTDTDMPLTPFNLSMINPHVLALGVYQAG
ncbi:hypothetical protein KC332_g13259 [Hortaea werneckii]|uniref:Protein rds1 n=2 Tax=Hortaea werneckii TaxID=91943 RepID=A0A3M7ISK3_HORWE|nr:hypothetical protein KC358_g13958 [Hortaea werneckii]OTA38137.1 hypothetical protein BTJ68_02035 [Hortaea werneckii EXF-2000]KAI6809548.1 hypothetical protein KC350_g12896 [Hortaea werneckii]KAI6836530.1 hypothetical protein KC342_g5081 [Hortaea werneckii]KAI6910774.1 hypothetical protein KC348_g13113 [Hortaea werneckii]